MYPFSKLLKWNDVVKPCIRPDHHAFDDVGGLPLSAINRGRSDGHSSAVLSDYPLSPGGDLLPVAVPPLS